MVVKFTSDRKHNFTKENIIEILKHTGDNEILALVDDPKNFILVQGSIHQSQYTHDNPYGYPWLKIQGYANNKLIPRLQAVHIYVCFNMFYLGKYIGCIIPNYYQGTDIPNIENIYGHWSMVGISYGHNSYYFGKKRLKNKKIKSLNKIKTLLKVKHGKKN